MSDKIPNTIYLIRPACGSCYARTEAAGRKKLDDRSRILVHLGTEPGSKAYRLFDPSSKRIIVSRNVIFEETKSWNWNNAEKTELGDAGELVVWVKQLGDGSNRDAITVDEEDENKTTVEVTEEEELNEEDDEAQPQLRRSQRVTTRPTYLDEYVSLAKTECELLLMIINDEPWDFNEAK